MAKAKATKAPPDGSPMRKDLDRWASEHLSQWMQDVAWRGQTGGLKGREVAEIISMNLTYKLAVVATTMDKTRTSEMLFCGLLQAMCEGIREEEAAERGEA